MRWIPHVLVAASFAPVGWAQSKTSGTAGVHKVITVHEGTNMAVAVSPDRETILFDLQGMIYTMPMAGGQAKRITDPVVEASHPVFSPKGDLVAIQSYQGGTFHIWTMHPDGTGLRQVTTGHGDDREPAFSPDGRTIAFASDRAFQGSYSIWTVDVASGALKQLTSSHDDEYEPTFSPDGGSITYVDGFFVPGAPGVGGVQGRTLMSVDVASGATKRVAGDPKVAGRFESPSYSPDGTLAVVSLVGAGALSGSAVMTVDGKPVSTKYDDTFPFPAVWVSRSEMLYTANGHILRADVTSGKVEEIPFTADIDAWRPKYTPKHFDFDETTPHMAKGIFAPALSPDGKMVAFVALNQLQLLKVGDPKPRALTHDAFYKQGPMWSPDGRQIAYVSDKGGVENVYILDVATGADRPLAEDKAKAQIFPVWSPDAKRIAWQDQTGATWMTTVESGRSEVLAAATFFPGRPAFSPDGKTVLIATVKPYTRRFREGTSSILAVDVATKKTEWIAPAPFESVSTRTEDGPIYSPAGHEIAFVMDDLLYTMPVDETGRPAGKAELLNGEITDAPTWSADGSKILYVSVGKLRMIDRRSKTITPVPVTLTWKQDKPTGSVLIHAARVWSGKGSAVLNDQDVLVTANRIVWVAPHGTRRVPSGARSVEAPRSTLLPGLWESHAHPNSDNSIYYGDRLGRLWMVYGITTLRDMADQAYRAVEQKESFLSGAATGPRLFATGEAIDGERTYYPMMIPTTSEEQLHREFARLKGLDFDFMKLYVRLPYAWVKEGANFAHTQMGVQTAGHYLLPAVALGNDGMSHVSATARTGYAYSRSLTGRSYEDVRDLIADSGMWTISTLLNQGVVVDMPSLADDPRYRVAPPWETERLVKGRDAALHTPQDANLERAMREEATVKAVLENKGLVIGGTDSPLDLPSTSLHLNLISQVKYGLQPWQALQTVTSAAAKAAALDGDLGTIAPGKLADMILVEGNPLTEIKDITRVQCVMKNGRMQSVAAIAAPFQQMRAGEDVCPAR
ncbi:MAG TPA: amidohydrolase family protein [Acidobacteriaceae bacterium]|jgi:Tol biopolymer transport system component|nr:amidohydrolase family protein [Acidobacteriaceae bacterium]